MKIRRHKLNTLSNHKIYDEEYIFNMEHDLTQMIYNEVTNFVSMMKFSWFLT